MIISSIQTLRNVSILASFWSIYDRYFGKRCCTASYDKLSQALPVRVNTFLGIFPSRIETGPSHQLLRVRHFSACRDITQLEQHFTKLSAGWESRKLHWLLCCLSLRFQDEFYFSGIFPRDWVSKSLMDARCSSLLLAYFRFLSTSLALRIHLMRIISGSAQRLLYQNSKVRNFG